MKVLFYLFGFPVYFFGVMIALAMLAGIFIAYREVKRKELEVDILFDLVLYGILSALIGARVFYILFYDWSYYVQNPGDILKINEGGLSIHGGLLGAFIFAFCYFRKQQISFFAYADALAPGIILGQGIGRVGCDVFGKVMSTAHLWGIERQGQLLHPVQVYEFLLDYLVFFILWNKRKIISYNGQLFLWYVILFSINRGTVEFFRENPPVSGWFSISHLLSVLFIAGALTVISFARRAKIDPPLVVQEEKPAFWQGLIYMLLMLILSGLSALIFYMVQTS